MLAVVIHILRTDAVKACVGMVCRYHRHKYGLGEHYSSARLLAKADPKLD